MDTTQRTRLTVTPRDLQPGDLIQRLNPDLSIGYVAIVGIEAVRFGERATRYRVFVDGDDTAMWFAPSKQIEVRR